MKNLSLNEFDKMCNMLRPECFVYSSDNQAAKIKHNNIRAVARYKIMRTFLNPNTIIFTNDSNTLCFEQVKYIQLYDDKQTVGTVFNIVCRGISKTDGDSVYTMIAD